MAIAVHYARPPSLQQKLQCGQLLTYKSSFGTIHALTITKQGTSDVTNRRIYEIV